MMYNFLSPPNPEIGLSPENVKNFRGGRLLKYYPASRASISSLSSLLDVVFQSVGFAQKC